MPQVCFGNLCRRHYRHVRMREHWRAKRGGDTICLQNTTQ